MESGVEEPVVDRDLNAWAVGCYTSQIRIKQKHRQLEGELLVPTTVKMLIDSGKCDVKVIPTGSVWKGVTYIEDSEPFREFIREEKTAGNYPKDLWAKEKVCV